MAIKQKALIYKGATYRTYLSWISSLSFFSPWNENRKERHNQGNLPHWKLQPPKNPFSKFSFRLTSSTKCLETSYCRTTTYQHYNHNAWRNVPIRNVIVKHASPRLASWARYLRGVSLSDKYFQDMFWLRVKRYREFSADVQLPPNQLPVTSSFLFSWIFKLLSVHFSTNTQNIYLEAVEFLQHSLLVFQRFRCGV